MKAIILSAGIGSRLGNITDKIPKPMLKIRGKPVLEWNIKTCKNAGVEDVFINLHYLPGVIKNYFGNGNKFGVNIKYSFEPSLLGTAGALLSFLDKLNDEPFYVIYGDSYISTDLLVLEKFHLNKRSDFSILLTHQNKARKSGLVLCDENQRIISFTEKPNVDDEKYYLVNAGIYLISSPKVFDYIKPKIDFGYDVFPALLANNFKVYGMVNDAELITIDTPNLYRKWVKTS
jgi:NDP-sugar pyrophosphorylase family protein